MSKYILQLEINEVSWRFMKKYLETKKYKNLEKFFGQAKCYTSLVVDSGEMSPWVVWPTIHRGANENFHKVRSLGQDPSTFQGSTIWEDVRAAGKNIGVFGPIQSWPAKDPGPGGFYVPDTFAHDEKCIPASLDPLQKFNLSLVSKNIRVRGGGFISSVNLETVSALMKSSVKWKTILRIVNHLAREKLDSRYCARRAIYQNILFWDVFKGLFHYKNPPAYASYFSNHLASAMHRYWSSIFPEEFPETFRPKDDFNKKTLDFAVQVLDDMLGDVLVWMKENPELSVVLLTGLGQDTKIRNKHCGVELLLTKVQLLLANVGVREQQFKKLLAMAPQTAVDIEDVNLRKTAMQRISAFQCASGMKPFVVSELGPSLSISLVSPPLGDSQAGYLLLEGKKFPFADLGIEAHEIDPGTAYHIPEGIFAIAGPGAQEFSKHWSQEQIPDDKIKGEILRLLNIG